MYPFRVSIRYAREDRPLARELHDRLAALGLLPWWDEDIEPGTGFTQAIRARIAAARVVLPLLTARSSRSPSGRCPAS